MLVFYSETDGNERIARADGARMSRPLRSSTVRPGHPHHVILRGNNKRRLFSYRSCRLAFLRRLLDASRRWRCSIHAIVLMSNHVHLVVTPPSAEALSGFVKDFSQRYAQWRNRTRGSTGKLFEQRFEAEAIEDEAHMAATLPYVELNPVRAGIVDDPRDYLWSTYAFHADPTAHTEIPRELWVPCDWYLALGSTPESRRHAYVEHVRRRAAEHDARIDALEDRHARSGHRPQRPDGTSAAEELAAYGCDATKKPTRPRTSTIQGTSDPEE